MRLMALLTFAACLLLLASGCKSATPPSDRDPGTPDGSPKEPPAEKIALTPEQRCECVTLTADGRLASKESLQSLRTRIEEKASKLKLWRTQQPKDTPVDDPKEKPPSLIVRAKATNEGSIESITFEKDGKSTALPKPTVVAFHDALKAEAGDGSRPLPLLVLVVDGRMVHDYFVQLLDTTKRTGFTDVSLVCESTKEAPKLAPLGDDPGGKLIEDAPLVVLRWPHDTPLDAVERLTRVLRGWGVNRVRIEPLPEPKK